MSIDENIRYFRKNAGLTQKQLADKVGVNEVTIRSYEGGKYKQKTETLCKLAKAFNCNINEILDKPFDLSNGIFIDTDNLDELSRKIEKLSGHKLISENVKSDDYFEIFLCYLESLGYKLSIYDYEEMCKLHIEPENENDFYIGIQDNKHDNVTFFHKKDFLIFQKEVEQIVEYEIYKQFSKSNDTE